MKPSDLREVNAECNAFPYKADPVDFDDWSPADASGGDCDSFAVAKLRRLVARGWPISALRIGLCYVETGEYHAVLVVKTEDGERVLDNRWPDVQTLGSLHAIGYRPDCIQREGGSRREWAKWTWEN